MGVSVEFTTASQAREGSDLGRPAQLRTASHLQ